MSDYLCACRPLVGESEPFIERDGLNSTHYFDDPVAAYSRLASLFADLSSRRERYLRGIEKCIVSRISSNAKKLLDVGAGDGSRALRIASAAGISEVVLVEPSKEMSAAGPG